MGGLRESIRASHDPGGVPAAASMPHDGASSDNEQAPQGSLAHFRRCAKLLFAAGRAVQWGQPQPSSEVAALLKCRGRRGQSDKCCCCCRAHTGYGCQPPRGFVVPDTACDLDVKMFDPVIQQPQRINQQFECQSGGCWQLAARILQLFNELDDVRWPWGTITPYSARWPRRALITWVRGRIKRSRARNTTALACCSALLTATKRIVGR
ncbi:hypothetical protein ABIF90_007256 [Bradyrhizobium japonicum]